ncbi:LysR family transcriptional regulator [Oxalobacteraceae bacterium]|nr:LysR family transcriptional regulator [Oxalobacteraceae bacterium]
MEPLHHLSCFIHSAEGGSFSTAARQLGLTPAAVSKNIARLESNLGVRLFQRSTRSLKLTEEGERFLAQVSGPLAELKGAIAGAGLDSGTPAGRLKVGLAPAFGQEYLVPMLGEFLLRYPGVLPDWHFDNRQVDLIGDGFDAAIGGGIELTSGVVARELARIRVVVVASPAYMAGRTAPRHPAELANFDGIVRRSASNGRLRSWNLQNSQGEEVPAELRPVAIFDDPGPMASAASHGLGLALLPVPHALPYLERGQLVRLLPDWSGDTGALYLYYSSKKQLPAKTRVFVDFIVQQFREQGLGVRLSQT